MGTNLVGPFGTDVGQSYVEPAFPDSGDTQFSWFVDCSDDVTPDGTKWMANWANRMMQQVRRAVVGMGIPLNETNGDSLLDAIKRAHRPIVNVGGGAAIHKGEKMPEWQHELRTIVGVGSVSAQVVGDTIVITGAAGSSVTLQSVGAGVPVYKGISGSVHQFRSLMAEAGLEVVSTANHATFRLAPIAGWSLLMRNAASSDVPTGVAIDELTEEENPSLVDWVMLQRNPGRQLRKVQVSKLRGKTLVGQGTSVLGVDTAVMAGTIPSAGVPSTIAFRAALRAQAYVADNVGTPFAATLEVNTGSGWVAVTGGASAVALSADASTTLTLDVTVPLVGHVVDAPGSVAWRLSTNGLLRAQSSVTWLQFA